VLLAKRFAGRSAERRPNRKPEASKGAPLTRRKLGPKPNPPNGETQKRTNSDWQRPINRALLLSIYGRNNPKQSVEGKYPWTRTAAHIGNPGGTSLDAVSHSCRQGDYTERGRRVKGLRLAPMNAQKTARPWLVSLSAPSLLPLWQEWERNGKTKETKKG